MPPRLSSPRALPLALFPLIVAAALHLGGGGPLRAAQPPAGALTLLHASPDAGALAAFIDGRPLDGPLSYGRTLRADVPPEGSVRLTLSAAADPARVVLDRSVELSPGGSTLLVIGGGTAMPGLVSLDTSALALEPGRARLTFLSALAGPESVTLDNAAGGTLAASAAFTPSAPVTFEARRLALEARTSPDVPAVATTALESEPGRSYALVLLPAGGDLAAPALLVIAGPRGSIAPAVTTAGAPGSVLVREDFSDAMSGVLPPAAPAGSLLEYGYSGGEYLLRNAGVETRSVAVPGDFTDATIAVDARLIGEIDRRTVSVGCRFRSDAGGNYGYRLRVEPGAGLFRLVREDGMRDTLLVNLRRSTAINRGLGVNRLELTCSGATITASINGVQVVSMQDATYGSGSLTLGVGARASGLTSEARFDNLVVIQR